MSEAEQRRDNQPASPLDQEVQRRFGVLPNFFRLAPSDPAITANLWGFAKFGYLDNPLPSLFKERLFVYLSRFCEMRYCIARHVGFLAGLGRPSGDVSCSPESVEDIVELLRKPLPRGVQLNPYISQFTALGLPNNSFPETGSAAEEALFACASHVFLQTTQANECLEALRQAIEPTSFQHLLVFLAFVRTAHYWTKVHPELTYEDDVQQLLEVHEALAHQVLQDAESSCDVSQVLSHELHLLRSERTLWETVRQRERQLHTIADNAPVLLAHLDHNRCYQFVNQSYAATFQLTPAEVVGKHMQAILGTEAYSIAAPHVDRVLAGETVEYEMELPANQQHAWHAIRVAYRPERNAEGNIVGFVAAITNITERIRAERELQQRESFARGILGSITDAFLVVDPQWKIRFANGEFVRRMERPGAVHGEKLWELFPVAIGSHAYVQLHRAMSSRRAAEYEVYHAPWERWFLDKAFPMENGDLAIYSRDITERRMSEERLRETEERFRVVFESAAIGMGRVSFKDAKWIDVNNVLCNIVGRSRDEMLASSWPEITHPDDIHLDLIPFRQMATGELDSYAVEKRFIHKRGHCVWARLTLSLVRNAQGEPDYEIAIVEDISQRRQNEQALYEASRQKDEFLATLAHELRNPLAPIRNGLEIMKLAGGDMSLAKNARIVMERQLEQMTHLVNDLMDLSRISRGKIELRRAILRIDEAIGNAIDSSRSLIDDRCHQLEIDMPQAPILVDGDATRLSQVFANLLNNAAKYTEPGGQIRLSVCRQDTDVIVCVEDSGVGIPSDMLGKVFEMFTQVDRTLEKSQGGLGIGLNIVKRLVELHEGSITVESGGPHQGSCFSVRLPTVVQVDANIQSHDSSQVSQIPTTRRILVVDDNVDGARTLAMMLKMMGNDTAMAHNGIEAIDVVETFKPDVILMDIGMPKLNGYEACRRIRQMPQGKSVVIIAQTGWGQEDDKRKAEEAGFDFHLTKPIELRQLEAKLRESLQVQVEP